MTERVLLESTKRAGATRKVSPVLAAILIKSGLFRRMDVVAEPVKPARKKRTYKRRDMQAEE